ncbi:hypothetical protein DSM3645_22976 [Blastopirellula marina DSM 3645]|uniref:Uncharacterized protein n=1 Tax=Blastopirellula marina DSM 3645 TaxID=314230 RepID=A3ZQ32_9BACT|nr:hypothetical protein DSM3645_22976 [Blastopirellula marina DSM 3645]
MLLLTLLVATFAWSAVVWPQAKKTKNQLRSVTSKEASKLKELEAIDLRVQISAGVLQRRPYPSPFFLDAKLQHDKLVANRGDE